MPSTDYFDTPVFLIAYNRLTPLQQVVSWLETAGYTQLHIIDNASDYPPLLQWLADSPHTVHRMDRNHGHLVLWKSGAFKDIIEHRPFVLNDCDVLPGEDCPRDIVARLAAILDRYPAFTKAGLSLRIDDLPDHYALKAQVQDWERRFWEHPLEDGALYEAALDTTFAYYRPGIGPDDPRWWRSLRTAPPLTARHLPWYSDTAHPTEEDLYYQSHLREMSSQWSTTDPAILKEQNIKLQMQVHALQKELALLKQGIWPHARARARQRLVRAADRLGLGAVLRAFYHRILKR
ncbi:hypothetical protein BN940_00071 [Castellaniella defragrans 65Phen]|uniref:Glycosyltransferase 2-like domain-containing protein n=1 Tax=Castellaniella defragrans (strain DSM 12143 / CCUG 39792 / 65Phen) TaxID=1437824 RepID=W8X857_CASD6|nr:hypothetical protein [Castellaniella defragrans]CDM22495.1 hypothetical protein BN940_00071 [Castellaniella defragrans 65Phen]